LKKSTGEKGKQIVQQKIIPKFSIKLGYNNELIVSAQNCYLRTA